MGGSAVGTTDLRENSTWHIHMLAIYAPYWGPSFYSRWVGRRSRARRERRPEMVPRPAGGRGLGVGDSSTTGGDAHRLARAAKHDQAVVHCQVAVQQLEEQHAVRASRQQVAPPGQVGAQLVPAPPGAALGVERRQLVQPIQRVLQGFRIDVALRRPQPVLGQHRRRLDQQRCRKGLDGARAIPGSQSRPAQVKVCQREVIVQCSGPLQPRQRIRVSPRLRQAGARLAATGIRFGI